MTKVRIVDYRFAILVTLQVIVLMGIGFSLWKLGGKNSKLSAVDREVGNKLQAAGLVAQAIPYYEKAVGESTLGTQERAHLIMTIVDLLEKAGQYERALGWLYQVVTMAPGAKIEEEASRKIVALLERLKKYAAAKQALAHSTALERRQEGKRGSKGSGDLVVVAEIGERRIFQHEYNEALDEARERLGEKEREALHKKEGKTAFLKKLVADEILVQKAERLQYDQDPKLVKQLESMRKQMLVFRILEEEIGKKISVEQADLLNYFKTHREKYASQGNAQSGNKSKKKAPVQFEEVKDQVALDYRMEKSQDRYQKLIEETLAGEKITLYEDKIP